MEGTSNKLWRFGDSWSLTMDQYDNIESNHSKYVADYFGLDYINKGWGGYSNLQIFNDLIKNQNDFKHNDIVLINFASIYRVAVVQDGIVSCISNGGEYGTQKLIDNVIINDMVKPISEILFYLIRTSIQSLIDRGVKVYFFFLDERIDLNLNCELHFESKKGVGFIDWCRQNGYEDLSPAGNLHYKLGSQKDIANKIIELIQKNEYKFVV